MVEERATIALLQRDLAWLRGEHERMGEEMTWLRDKYDESQRHLEWLTTQHAVQGRHHAAALATIEQLRAKVAHKNEVIARLRAKRR